MGCVMPQDNGLSAPGEPVRQGSLRDYVSLLWFLESSRWIYQFREQENLFELLAHQPSALCVHKGILRAALLSSLYRSPVAAAHILALRDESDLQLVLNELLPYAEGRLAERGARWMSFTNAPNWLLNGLAIQGYRLYDKVIVYIKQDWQITKKGNLKINVRRASPDDHVALVALDAEAFEPFWQLNPTILQDAIRSAAYLLVAELNRRLVGYLLAERQGDEAHIGRVAVAPDHQRQGIGTRLMVEALSLLREADLKVVYLNTQEDNASARALYEGLGFRPTGEYDLIWAKQLPASK